MQSSCALQNNKSRHKSELIYFMYLGVLCLMFFLRDVFAVSIPLVMFMGYFGVGYLIFDYDHSLALTAMMPLLGHGIQTNYLVLIAILFYVLKSGWKIAVKAPLFIMIFLIIYELFHIMNGNDSIAEYLRYVIQYAYIGLILSESRINNLLKNPIIVIKTFIFMAFYFMLDVLFVTLNYFTLDEMLEDNFRFGSLTDLIGDKPSLGDNENMVAMFAFISISLIGLRSIARR